MRYTGKPGIPAGTGAKRIVRTFRAYTSTGVATGIEPTSFLCLGTMWRKTFPAQGRGERHLKALNAL
ncbi:MAG: hypothetical protein DRH43_01800 [Deltaproteobacteria bacterium]|nr:MAG: hypothetical protein DRH43_01800 [Deltaproteobacteria bacterium]